MELKTGIPIDTDAVEAICSLRDDLYRLRWVSYAYYDLSKRLTAGLGENASWPSFARWSAYTISESLRLDEVNPRLEELLRDHALPPKVAGPLVDIQKKLRSLDDGAMPTVLALGNRMVFHEVGWTVAHFLAWIENQNGRDDGAWTDYKKNIEPFDATDFFRPAYVEWLRDGMSAYYDAWWESDATRKAQHVLRGNILIGAYEQWRVDSFFNVALDFNPGALVKELRQSCHDDIGKFPIGLKHAGTRRALRHQWAAINWMADAYAVFLTRFVLTWDAPLYGGTPAALRLGCNVPARRSMLPPALELEDLSLDTQKLFESFDRSGGQLRGSGARNWRRFTDRMSFIVNLFRSQQQNPYLRVNPSFDDLRLLELQLDDEHLDELRKAGDPLDDAELGDVVPEGTSAQEFAHGFVTRGEPYELLRRHQPNVDFPTWGDSDKIKKGQEFFDKNSMEIAAALFTASLPKAYTAAKGSRVLLATAELVSDAGRRIAETARLLLDVMAPDRQALRPGSHSYKTVLTVRGFHSAIRTMLGQQEPWKSDPDETPINQEDLLGTLTTFTVVVIETLEKMGITVSDEDREAYLHTWLVVGHLLGIDYNALRRRPFREDLQPLTYFEMQLVRDAIFRRQAAPSPSGEILTRALIKAEDDVLPVPLRPLPPAAIRRFIGDDAADMIGVPPAGPVRVLVSALGPIGSAADWVARGKVLQPRLNDMAAGMLRSWIAQSGAEGWAVDAVNSKVNLGPPTEPQIDLNAEEREPSMWADDRPSRSRRARSSA